MILCVTNLVSALLAVLMLCVTLTGSPGYTQLAFAPGGPGRIPSESGTFMRMEGWAQSLPRQCPGRVVVVLLERYRGSGS
jgi:hypothetical protein